MTAEQRVDQGSGLLGATPSANTHVHLAPNFSAFGTAEEAVEAAAREGIAVMGASNFHDLGIYARFRDAAVEAGIVPVFGIEIICLVDDLQQAGIRVNDPANPGRMYLCGKGIDPFGPLGSEAREIMTAIRAGDEARMRRMADRLAAWFAGAGILAGPDHDAIVMAVAERARVPAAWVVLQERHLARAYQEVVFDAIAADHRTEVLARLFEGPTAVDPRDPAAVQAELRARLIRAGRPAFEPESQIASDAAYRLTLALGGIPCYPTLADGVKPVCPWEEPPDALAERLLERGIHLAELIPLRNQPGAVDAYVTAFRSAGILVLAGSEHNTPQRVPLRPVCADGSPPSASASAAFWEATCVVVAHQHEVARGAAGYVDPHGRLAQGFPDAEGRIRWYAELGRELIAQSQMERAR